MEQRDRPQAREDRLSLPAIPKGASSLRDGAVSLVFHVPYEVAAEAFRVHELQGKSVTLSIEVDE